MNRFFQSHIQNLQLTTVKMAYVTCLVTKNFTFELPGKCVKAMMTNYDQLEDRMTDQRT